MHGFHFVPFRYLYDFSHGSKVLWMQGLSTMNIGRTLINAYCQSNNFENKNILESTHPNLKFVEKLKLEEDLKPRTKYKYVYSYFEIRNERGIQITNAMLQTFRFSSIVNSSRRQRNKWMIEWMNVWTNQDKQKEEVRTVIWAFTKSNVKFNFQSIQKKSIHFSFLSFNQYILSNICWWLIQVRSFVSVHFTFIRWLDSSSLHIETDSNTSNKMKLILLVWDIHCTP